MKVVKRSENSKIREYFNVRTGKIGCKIIIKEEEKNI